MDNILEEVRTILQTTPFRWEHLTQSVSPDLINLPPAPKEWSALECLQHLVDAERSVFPVRVQAILAGQDFPAFDPDSQGTKPGSDLTQKELAEEFTSLRAASHRALEIGVQRSDDRARHEELGELYSHLTPREREIIVLLARGYSAKQIGRELDISHRTAEIHRARIMEKLEVQSLAELVALAVSLGIR